MSFASDIKNELLRAENKTECCAIAELCGIICYAGSISYTDDEMELRIATESAAAARRCFALLKRVFGIAGDVNFARGRSGRGGNAYHILVTGEDTVNIVLYGLYLYDERYLGHISFRVNPVVEESACCKKAFIRGAFLGGGSITNPEKAYHLEFITHHLNLSRDMERLLESFGTTPKTVLRKSNYVTYFKSGDEIGDVLSIIGAHKSLLEFMNIRIMKETRNYVNRKVNCETANLDKTLDAAFLQVSAIKKIKKAGKFEALPQTLKEPALLRLRYKDASLKEIGNMLGLTKSGVNHRFRKIIEISEKL